MKNLVILLILATFGLTSCSVKEMEIRTNPIPRTTTDGYLEIEGVKPSESTIEISVNGDRFAYLIKEDDFYDDYFRVSLMLNRGQNNIEIKNRKNDIFIKTIKLSVQRDSSNNEKTRAAELDSIAKKEKADEIAFVESEEGIKYLKTKAGKIWNKNRDWSKIDCERLANNLVWSGMGFDMAIYLFGLPDKTERRDESYGIVNEYTWYDLNPVGNFHSNGETLTEYHLEGKVHGFPVSSVADHMIYRGKEYKILRLR
jgi:hypothetical protein